MKTGDIVKAPLTSTSARELEILRCGFTAEVGDNTPQQYDRVPAAIGEDRHGRLYAIVWWKGRWLGVHHRTLSMVREWEDESGNLVERSAKDMIEEAINNHE